MQLPRRTILAGSFLALTAEGNPVAGAAAAAGAGADVGLRTELASSDGGQLVALSTGRSLESKAAETLSVGDMPTFQAAVDQSASGRRQLYAPTGTYGHASLPDGVSIRGEGPLQTVLERVSARGDVLVNTSTDVSRNVTLENLTIRGGRYGLNLTTDEVSANYHLTNVTFEGSVGAALHSAKSLILCKFDKVIFNATAGNQVEVLTGTANANYFLGCEFIELAGAAIKFAAASEANEFISCRFEARRVADSTGLSVFDLNGTKGLRVRGGYFEGTHRTILTETNSMDMIWFENSRFSGQETDILQQERFVSNGVVGFDSNEFVRGSYGSQQMFTKGRNIGLDTRLSWIWLRKDDRISHFISPRIVLTNNVAVPVATFTRPATTGGASSHFGGSGKVIATFTGADASGNSIFTRFERAFVVGHDRFDSSAVMEIGFGASDVAHIPSGAAPTVLLSASSAYIDRIVLSAGLTMAGGIDGAEMTIEIVFTSLSAGDLGHVTAAPVLACGPTHPSA